MKIGVYNQPEGGIGGAEYCTAVLAEAFSHSHDVEIIHHKSETLQVSDFAGPLGIDLSRVRFLYAVPLAHVIGHSSNPLWCYREARGWQANLSEPYDLFVNITHALPPFCHAPKGVLIVLFPWFDRHQSWPWRVEGSSMRDRLRRLYYDWEWQKRFETYQVKMAISQFTQMWTKRRWNVDCEVVYPPSEGTFISTPKTNSILSVGRFTAGGLKKKQLEMATLFRRMQDRELGGWEFFIVGGLSNLPEDRAYHESVRGANPDVRAHILVNVERPNLKSLYQHASIFWHAAGYGDDLKAHPEFAEHFGIVTVDAMLAGCVPVVFNAGGQAEIVEHEVSGFLWSTLEELKEFTVLLVRDQPLRARMSEAARLRARLFSSEGFLRHFMNVLRPLGPSP